MKGTPDQQPVDQEVIEMQKTESYDNQVVTYSVTLADIAKLAEKHKEVPADLSIKENYKLVKGAISEIKPRRGKVEKRRKELKADALAYGKKVDAAAKEITEKLLEIETPFATAKKDFDTAEEIRKREAAQAEEKRIDNINDRMTSIKNLVIDNVSSSSAVIKEAMDELEANFPCDWAEEFAETANLAAQESKAKLGELFIMKLQQENQAAELAAAEAKRLKDEEKARIKREAEVEAERKKIEAEREALRIEQEKAVAEQAQKDAEAKAEREKLEAEAKAERERLEKEQTEKDAAAKAKEDKLKEEIEALKKQQEEKEAPVVEPEPELPQEAQPISAPKEQPKKNSTGHSDQYRETGNAMLALIKNKAVTKALLDAIINGDIPNIQFTGQV